jgi:phage gpG-like protein
MEIPMPDPAIGSAKDALKIEIKGLKEAQKKMEQVLRDTKGTPVLMAFRQATLLVERDAKLNLVAWSPPGGPGHAGVDTGRLRASITPEVRVQNNVITGVVGSAMEYAPYQELGTGVFVGRPPHFPPPDALNVWAARHGGPKAGGGFQVAMAIFKRGGLRPLLFLQRALDKNKDKIPELINKAFQAICNK